MISLEKKALYNLLRMHWLNDPSIKVELWQVEDYRNVQLGALFDRLQQLSIHLDPISFLAYADECESPEELAESFTGDRNLSNEQTDLIYLLVFELWRRLVTGKPSLSIFCNDLDHLIYLYDQGELENVIILQDSLIRLLSILNENVDLGIEPDEALRRLSAYCANNLETFLYDFISDQIEEDHEFYAQELIEGFALYFANNKWFDLLRAKLFAHSNPKSANRLLSQIIEDYLEEKDLDFGLELLSFVSEVGTPFLFQQIVKHAASLLKTEEDFHDLLAIVMDYYHRLDREDLENSLQNILNHRSARSMNSSWNDKDPDLIKLMEIIHS